MAACPRTRGRRPTALPPARPPGRRGAAGVRAIADDGERFLLSPAERHALVARHLAGNRALAARHGLDRRRRVPGAARPGRALAAAGADHRRRAPRRLPRGGAELLGAAQPGGGARRPPAPAPPSHEWPGDKPRGIWETGPIRFRSGAGSGADQGAGLAVRELHLHVGPQKTGSTYLHRLLVANAELVAAAGLGFAPGWDPATGDHQGRFIPALRRGMAAVMAEAAARPEPRAAGHRRGPGEVPGRARRRGPAGARAGGGGAAAFPPARRSISPAARTTSPRATSRRAPRPGTAAAPPTTPSRTTTTTRRFCALEDAFGFENVTVRAVSRRRAERHRRRASSPRSGSRTCCRGWCARSAGRTSRCTAGKALLLAHVPKNRRGPADRWPTRPASPRSSCGPSPPAAPSPRTACAASSRPSTAGGWSRATRRATGRWWRATASPIRAASSSCRSRTRAGPRRRRSAPASSPRCSARRSPPPGPGAARAPRRHRPAVGAVHPHRRARPRRARLNAPGAPARPPQPGAARLPLRAAQGRRRGRRRRRRRSRAPAPRARRSPAAAARRGVQRPGGGAGRLRRARRRDSRLLAEAEALLTVRARGWAAAAPLFARLPPPGPPSRRLGAAARRRPRAGARPRAARRAARRRARRPPGARALHRPLRRRPAAGAAASRPRPGLRCLLFTDRAAPVPGWETVLSPRPGPGPRPARRASAAPELPGGRRRPRRRCTSTPALRPVGNLAHADRPLAGAAGSGALAAPRGRGLARGGRGRAARRPGRPGARWWRWPRPARPRACRRRPAPATPARSGGGTATRGSRAHGGLVGARRRPRRPPTPRFAAALADARRAAGRAILPAALGPLDDGLFFAAPPGPPRPPPPAPPPAAPARLPLRRGVRRHRLDLPARRPARRARRRALPGALRHRLDQRAALRGRVVVLTKWALQTLTPEEIAALAGPQHRGDRRLGRPAARPGEDGGARRQHDALAPPDPRLTRASRPPRPSTSPTT